MNMVSISGTRIEIRKFDDKNFVMWKEMMQDVVIIRRQVEAIRHNEKPASMTIKEWTSIDEIARSIRMHVAENFYFNMAKETTTFKLWVKLQAIYEKQSSSSKLILVRKLFNMKMRETDPETSHINTLFCTTFDNSFPKLNLDETIGQVLAEEIR